MTADTYVVPVKYYDLLTHQEQLAAAKFDWITDYDNRLIRKDPTEHLFPLPKGQIEQRITLVHLTGTRSVVRSSPRWTRSTSARRSLPNSSRLPSCIRISSGIPLVGLGSVWVASGGNRHVLSAYGHSGERSLLLGWGGDEWREHCRFPAVCK